MWTVTYGPNKPDGDGQVKLWKSSETTARQDFAEKVQAAPTKGYAYVTLERDGTIVERWPKPGS